MRFRRPQAVVALPIVLLLLGVFPTASLGQQVIERGPFGKPAQVLDETGQWSTPLLMSSDHDVEMYIPDVTNPEWLKRNYREFLDKKQYVLSMFTLYRTTKACRLNQIGWGFGDAAHLDACIDIGYRVRQASVDAHMKTVTLIMAAMVGQDGQILPESIQRQSITRTWAELDPNTRAALEKATELIARQVKLYDLRMQGVR